MRDLCWVVRDGCWHRWLPRQSVRCAPVWVRGAGGLESWRIQSGLLEPSVAAMCCVAPLPMQSLAQLRDVAAKWEAQAQGSLAQNERLKDLLEESATWSIPSAAPTAGAAGATAEAGAAVAAAAALAQQPAGADGGDGGEAAASAAGAGGARDGGVLSALCQRFERELLLEKAKTAQLDMQVRSVARHVLQQAGCPALPRTSASWADGTACRPAGRSTPGCPVFHAPCLPLHRALCMELTRAAQSSGQMQSALAPMLGGIEARLVQVCWQHLLNHVVDLRGAGVARGRGCA